jgi:hypothetical protein
MSDPTATGTAGPTPGRVASTWHRDITVRLDDPDARWPEPGQPVTLAPAGTAAPADPLAPAARLAMRHRLLDVAVDIEATSWVPWDELPQALRDRARALVDDLDPGWFDLDDPDQPWRDETERAAAYRDTGESALSWLADLAAGRDSHERVAERPRPGDPLWDAELEHRRQVSARAVDALDDLERLARQLDGSFPDDLRGVLEVIARRRGGVEGLVATRPGCWEADHLRHLAGLASHDDYEPWDPTAPEVEQPAAEPVEGNGTEGDQAGEG